MNDCTSESTFDRKVNLEARFIVVALHISYPEILRRVMERPDFVQWKEQELEIPWNLDFKKHEEQLKALESSRVGKYFDEEWEKIVYCLCDKSDWLRNNAINISRLLNQLRDVLDQAPEDEEPRDGEARDLDDSAIAILRNLIDSIRVISIDSEMLSGEIGGAAIQGKIFTNYAVVFAQALQEKLPKLKYEDAPSQIKAEFNEDEERWDWECGISESGTLTLQWNPEESWICPGFYFNRSGMRKAEADEFLADQIKGTEFNPGTWGGGKSGIFWLDFIIGDFNPDDITNCLVSENILERTVKLYKLARKCAKEMEAAMQ